MEVGIRELKQRLSHYVEQVAAGEVVVVTDRGRPKALLTPLPGADHLERGVEEGWIRAARRTGLGRARRHRSDRRVADVLEDDRA